jgi:hypothetical protein
MVLGGASRESGRHAHGHVTGAHAESPFLVSLITPAHSGSQDDAPAPSFHHKHSSELTYVSKQMSP